MKRKSWQKLLFVLYCVLMLWLLFGQRMDNDSLRELQLQPFRTLRLFWQALTTSQYPAMRWHALVNLLGNVAMFVPLGLLVPWIWQRWRKFWRHILLMTAVIVAVELSQFALGLGSCDIDDLILNLVGTTLGFRLWKWID